MTTNDKKGIWINKVNFDHRGSAMQIIMLTHLKKVEEKTSRKLNVPLSEWVCEWHQIMKTELLKII